MKPAKAAEREDRWYEAESYRLRGELLGQTGTDRPEMFEDELDLQVLLALIDQRRLELEAAARPLGKDIYVEEPADFVDRMAAYGNKPERLNRFEHFSWRE